MKIRKKYESICAQYVVDVIQNYINFYLLLSR